jgi:hypothetical protein
LAEGHGPRDNGAISAANQPIGGRRRASKAVKLKRLDCKFRNVLSNLRQRYPFDEIFERIDVFEFDGRLVGSNGRLAGVFQ